MNSRQGEMINRLEELNRELEIEEAERKRLEKVAEEAVKKLKEEREMRTGLESRAKVAEERGVEAEKKKQEADN